jgi:hypothetical protein
MKGIDLSKFPFKGENENNLALNSLSSVEAESLFSETKGDDKIPYPFYFSWFGAMIEAMKKVNDTAGIAIVIRTLYDSLGVDLPEIFDKIVVNDFIALFADELFNDFDDIACEDYSG